MFAHSTLLDPQRLAALQATGLLDTPAEPRFDRLTRVAARLAGAPVSVLSLLDAERGFFKSTYGTDQREVPLTHSLCRRVVEDGAPLVVGDVATDPRVVDCRAVTDFGVAAYAGVPLHAPDGHVLGALCVIDLEPRAWPDGLVESLADLAAGVTTELELRRFNQALQAHDSRRQAALDSALDAVVTMDAAGRIVDFNPSAEEMFRVTAAEAGGRDLADIMVPRELRERHRRGLARHLATGSATILGRRHEFIAVRADGSRFPVELAITRSDVDGRPFFTGFLRDLSAQRQAEAALRDTSSHLDAVIGSAPLVLAAIDGDGVYTLLEGRGLEQLGVDRADVLGRNFREVWADVPAFVQMGERALAGEHFSQEIELAGRVLDAVVAGATDDAGVVTSVTIVAVDVTERRQGERELERLAYHDRLTGLPNREHLEQCLEEALAHRRTQGGTAALLFVDLDQFKLVNDSLGHGGGDELLRQTADRLTRATRHNDLVARHGGDEFMLLLDDLGPEPLLAAEQIAAKLHATLEPPFTVNGASFEIGASIGISLYPRDGEYGEELLRKADQAMYQAKRSGRNASLAYERSDEDVHQRLTLTARLRRALARDEFVLHFQGLWDLQRREVVGVESLIRWEDPDLGLIPPLTFIAHAEEHGLIDRIGDWVIDAACAQAAAWGRQGLTPAVAFNVAPRQLQRAGFVTDLADAAARHGVDPRRLTVEITESAAMADPETSGRVLHDLGELGALVSIDDFGAGHSSLGRLRSLPVHGLKLDRSFLHGVPADAGAGSIIGGVLSLTSALGLTAIAEGIETEAQLDFLIRQGCRYGQGFHLSRPLEAGRTTALLRAASAVTP